MRQVAEHVGRRPSLAIKADRRGILFFLSASYVENEYAVSPVGFSINNIERHVIETVQKSGKLAEICGCNVVVDVAEVPMVSDIEDP
jgi:hypothetical protein